MYLVIQYFPKKVEFLMGAYCHKVDAFVVVVPIGTELVSISHLRGKFARYFRNLGARKKRPKEMPTFQLWAG